MKNFVQYIAIMLPGAVWGASFIATSVILEYVPPFGIAMIRAWITASFLFVLLRILGAWPHRDWREWLWILQLTVINLSAYVLTAWSQQFISGGLATILSATIALFTVIVAHFLTHDDRLSRAKVLGVLLGLVGVIILVGVGTLSELGLSLKGQLGVLFASFLYGLSGVLARPVLERQPQHDSSWVRRIRVLCMQFIMSASLITPITFAITDPTSFYIPPHIWGYLLFLGMGVTLGAQLVYYYLIETVGSSRTSMTMYMIPITGVLLGVLLLDEVVTWTMPVALVFILGGVYVVNRK